MSNIICIQESCLTIDLELNGDLSFNATPSNNRGHPSGRSVCLISIFVKCTVTLLSPLRSLAMACLLTFKDHTRLVINIYILPIPPLFIRNIVGLIWKLAKTMLLGDF